MLLSSSKHRVNNFHKKLKNALMLSPILQNAAQCAKF